MVRIIRFFACALACVAMLSTFGAAQSAATAELHVAAKDPSGAAITNAKVTARDPARNFERTVEKAVNGEYRLLQLPPGEYKVTVEAPGFARLLATDVRVTVGQAAELPVVLKIASQAAEMTVTGGAEMVETQRTSAATTIDQTRIDNLPINGRNYINFTLTNSQTARDNAPSIGAAPTSGLNIGGQRARANLVNVDGVDAVDNSVNGIRSTVSQEAVQEFQLITNGYAAEYGRASGGVVNIITRSGTNDTHGTAFGYLRNRNFQAVNPFSNVPNPAYTRVQAGFNLGGTLKKDKTFYFLSYETTRRQETGFSTIGQDGYGLVPFDASTLYGAPAGTFMIQATPQQAAFLSNPQVLASVPVAALQKYAFLVGGSSGIALNGSYPLAFALITPPVPNQLKQFPTSCNASNLLCNGLPASFASLASQTGNYPISEGTTLVDLRLDQKFTTNNTAMFRANVSPSTVTGLQVQGQNQNFGQNAFSRTAIQTYRDVAFTAQDTATIGSNKINELRFQFARRGLLFNFNNQTPDGPNVAVNIVGSAFIGREPFSFIRRTEERYQFVDNFSWSKGTHDVKFGADVNRLPVVADFTVNFGGVYNFGGLDAASLGFAAAGLTFPGFNAVQAYGLGIPTTLIQGVGNPHAAFSNTPLGFFIQDSWRVKPNLTLNYGVRYDVELVPTPPPLATLPQQGYNALGLVNGIPQDNNNVAPRIGIAWDPFKNGKTVIRASYGLFYDHPLLGLQFLAQATDASGTPQILLAGGSPCGTSGGANPSNLNATNTFQGTLGTANCLGPLAGAFGYDGTQQRFISNFPNSLWTNQNFLQPQAALGGLPTPLGFLPFGFPLAKDFQYAYSNQANFSIERDLGHGLAFSVGYNFNGGRHLNRPINANTVVTKYLVTNWQTAMAAATAAGLTRADANWPSSPFAAGVENLSLPKQYAPCGAVGGQPYVPAPLVNFFRPSGLNPSLTTAFGPCTPLAAGLLDQLFPGLVNGMPANAPNGVPFSDMSANFSNGSSVYHGLTANLRKRFSKHYEFLVSYTWSHAIDDSTDLQSPLAPQDSYFPNLERSNSTFDQRHRFVFSGVYQSGRVGDQGFASRLLSGWTVAPIIEASSGRPFTVITADPTNFQFAPNSARPNLVSQNAPVSACGDPVVSSPFVPGVFFQLPCALTGSGDGNLGRNPFTKPSTVFTDLRIARRIHFSERVAMDGIVDMFNIVNKFNVADVNPLYTQAGRPTAAYDPRQFQFGLKLNF